jgi:predicted small secreted protein
MKRSREVHLTLLAAAALSLTACRDTHRDCVDGQGHKLVDATCDLNPRPFGAHYLYGGSSGGHVGDYVVGGSVSRGGFGGIGGGDASGGE